jgi:hypothetical protein
MRPLTSKRRGKLASRPRNSSNRRYSSLRIFSWAVRLPDRVKGRHRPTIRSSPLYFQERTSRDAGAAVRPRGHDQGSGTSRSPSDLNYLTLSSSSVQALTLSPRAMRAMLSIETFRSDRSTPLRYVRLMPHSWAKPRRCPSVDGNYGLRRVESLQTMILLIYSTAEKSNSCWLVAPGSTRSVTMCPPIPAMILSLLTAGLLHSTGISGG